MEWMLRELKAESLELKAWSCDLESRAFAFSFLLFAFCFISMILEIDSALTPYGQIINNLVGHLKSADFFDVKKFPLLHSSLQRLHQ